MVEGARLQQAHRGAEHARDLRVVPAGVRGARLWVGDGMPHHHEAVELAEERDRRAVPGPPRHVGADPGEGEPGPWHEPHALEGLGDQLGGLELLEPELRLPPDRLAERDDLLPAPVDSSLNFPDQLRLGHGVLLPGGR